MHSKRNRLDRFIARTIGISPDAVRPLLASGEVRVDGKIATDRDQIIGQFTHIQVNELVLQANTPIYIMLHKPIGIVSATRDTEHPTVIDLLDRTDKNQLHIAGRLDRYSSGLILLTNDGYWSAQLAAPKHNVIKRYQVTLENPLTREDIKAFAAGMYFETEDLITRPAQLRIINKCLAEVSLTEGRYHQIKRMFGRRGNRVRALKRIAIGGLLLDSSLAPGQSRLLTLEEVSKIGRKS